jgi:hypothetical protein
VSEKSCGPEQANYRKIQHVCAGLGKWTPSRECVHSCCGSAPAQADFGQILPKCLPGRWGLPYGSRVITGSPSGRARPGVVPQREVRTKQRHRHNRQNGQNKTRREKRRRRDREMTLPGTCWAFSPLENPGISLRRGRRRGCAQPGDKHKASVRRQHRWLMRLSSERGAVSAVSGPLSGPEPCILGIF